MSDQRIQEIIRQLRQMASGSDMQWRGHQTLKTKSEIVIEAADLLESLQRQKEQQEPIPLRVNVNPQLRTEYETPHQCGYCGEHIASDWSYCPECGTPTGITANEPKGDRCEVST